MTLVSRRERLLFPILTTAGVLFAATIVIPRPAAVYAQEETIDVAPPIPDADGSVPPAADDSADVPDNPVLDLPQVVAVTPPATAPDASAEDASDDASVAGDTSIPDDDVPADSTATAAADQQPDQSNQQDSDLADYTAQGAGGMVAAPAERVGPGGLANAPMIPSVPLAAITTYSAIRVPAPSPFWYRVPRPLTTGPILPTSPMLTAPRGTSVIIGGWWHRAR